MSRPGSGKKPPSRMLKQRVKTGKGRTVSQKNWLERQINDPYVQEARRLGYRSRAAFKLIEIDDKYRLLKPGQRVIDLGAAPGGWTQVAVDRVNSTDEKPRVVGIDYLGMDAVPGAVVLEMDFLDETAPERLMETLGAPPDVVLSDMAAPTTGHQRTDHLRTVALTEAAAEFAMDVLAPGGHFLAKTFQGGTENELLARLKRHFAEVRHVKPKASRAESVELFLLAKGFKGRQDASED